MRRPQQADSSAAMATPVPAVTFKEPDYGIQASTQGADGDDVSLDARDGGPQSPRSPRNSSIKFDRVDGRKGPEVTALEVDTVAAPGSEGAKPEISKRGFSDHRPETPSDASDDFKAPWGFLRREINWVNQWTMLGCLVIAAALMVGHHCYHRDLVGEAVGDSFTQQRTRLFVLFLVMIPINIR
jgi:hypothetical protein